MQAFHNDPTRKAHYLARVRTEREADRIRHGVYWENGKGCAVGCTIHSGNHAAYETELGIPQVLARLEDSIFESLRPPEDIVWPEQFLEAIPVGADLSLVWPQFALALLSDAEYGVLQYVQKRTYEQQQKAIETVKGYYQEWVDTTLTPPAPAARAAADAAARAATDAAAHAAADAAGHAAYVAAAAAAYAAATTAADAAHAAAAKRYKVRLWQARTLLALLRAAPVQGVDDYEAQLIQEVTEKETA